MLLPREVVQQVLPYTAVARHFRGGRYVKRLHSLPPLHKFVPAYDSNPYHFTRVISFVPMGSEDRVALHIYKTLEPDEVHVRVVMDKSWKHNRVRARSEVVFMLSVVAFAVGWHVASCSKGASI